MCARLATCAADAATRKAAGSGRSSAAAAAVVAPPPGALCASYDVMHRARVLYYSFLAGGGTDRVCPFTPDA